MIFPEPEDSMRVIREGLCELRLPFVASELLDIKADPEFGECSPGRILAHLIRRETERRRKNRVADLMRAAEFKYPDACFDDTLGDPERKLSDTDIFWLKENFAETPGNILITGCTGAGKTWMACALGIAAVHTGKRVRYIRTAKFLRELEQAEETGTTAKAIREAVRLDVLILDDFGLNRINLEACRNLFEVIEERDPDKATVVVSQYPVKAWYELFSDATYAEAILDRMVQRARRVDMKGINMRERPGGTAT